MTLSASNIRSIDCVNHEGAIFQRTGYGKVAESRPSRLAHRALWIESNGPISDGLVVHHLCGNRLCINLDHLDLMDKGEHGRLHGTTGNWKTHCKHGHARLPGNLTANGTCRECHRRHSRESKERTRARA